MVLEEVFLDGGSLRGFGFGRWGEGEGGVVWGGLYLGCSC